MAQLSSESATIDVRQAGNAGCKVCQLTSEKAQFDIQKAHFNISPMKVNWHNINFIGAFVKVSS